MHKTLARLGLAQKSRSGQPSSTIPTSLQRALDGAGSNPAWGRECRSLSKRALKVIDGVNTKMTQLRGPAARGERLVAAVPQRHWRTSTVIAVLHDEGLVASWVFEGAINGELFLAYVEQVLVPTLSSGDLGIMIHLGPERVSGVPAAIDAAGAQFVSLPVRSLNLGPIEQVFAPLKAVLRAGRYAPSVRYGAPSARLPKPSHSLSESNICEMPYISNHPENALNVGGPDKLGRTRRADPALQATSEQRLVRWSVRRYGVAGERDVALFPARRDP